MFSSFLLVNSFCSRKSRKIGPLWESTQAYASDIAAFYSEAAANANAGAGEHDLSGIWA
jgi:hypothetical protein